MGGSPATAALTADATLGDKLVGTQSDSLPPQWQRAIVAVVIGVAAGWFCYARAKSRNLGAHDFSYAWHAARALLAGLNPYEALQTEAGLPFSRWYLYPLPNALFSTPFALLPEHAAGGVFFGVSSSLLAYGVTKNDWWRLGIFLSAPFVAALWSVQWSPLLVASALLPWLGWLAPVKPNLGLAALAYRPSWRTVWLAAAFAIASLAFLPQWPLDWLASVRHAPNHRPVILWQFGFVAMLSALRWRTREGRLMLAMTLVPSVPWYYDHLGLWLVPRAWVDMAILTACSWVSLIAELAIEGMTFGPGMRNVEPFVTLGIYLPAVLLLLRRPNATDHCDDGVSSSASAAVRS